jgi:hypothetical protein
VKTGADFISLHILTVEYLDGYRLMETQMFGAKDARAGAPTNLGFNFEDIANVKSNQGIYRRRMHCFPFSRDT